MIFEHLHPGTFIVLGDLMVDVFNVGTVSRVSPEASVLIMDFLEQLRVPGGAANVAINLVGLGNRVEVIGVVGDDENGRWLIECLNKYGVDTKGIFSVREIKTTTKERFATTQQMVFRVDYEHSKPNEAVPYSQITNYLERRILDNNFDGILVSDYIKGVIPARDCGGRLANLLKKVGQMSVLSGVDSKKKGTALNIYAGFDFIKPNLVELIKAVEIDPNTDNFMQVACENYLEKSQARAVLVSMGAEGLFYFNGSDQVHIPAIKTNVLDVTGAGDTVFALIMHALNNNLKWPDAMRLANIAASLVIQFQGTKAISTAELNKRIELLKSTEPEYFGN